MWWAPADVVALPTPNIGENRGRSFAGNIVTVLSPSMTNEALVSYSRLTLDNRFKDPSLLNQGAGGITFNGIFPAGTTSPYLPTDLLHGWGGSGQVGQLWAKANDVYAHNDALQFSNKLTKLAGAHGLKLGVSIERGQKQQNFQNLEAGQLWFGPDNDTGTGNSGADMLVGRVGQFNQGTAKRGNPSPGMPFGEFRYWNFDAFAQDSWKLRSNLTLEYGVRFGLLDQQRGARLVWAATSRPSSTIRRRARSSIPGTYQRVNGVCYVETGCAPDGVLPNRSPFALPRVNVAWDIDGEGNNVVRGGYGIFYNRNMGNVEYDTSLRLAPNAYQVATDFWAGGGYGNGVGLTYDTISEATLASRIGSIGINSLTPDSFTWPKTHSFSVSYARRIPGNQVVEASYVGTRGRDLVSQSNGNVMPYGVMLSGTFNGVDLSVPVNRYAVATVGDNLARFRPYNALNGITIRDFRGSSDYDSFQLTLSRQTGRRLPVFRRLHDGPRRGDPRRRVFGDRPVRSEAHVRSARRGSYARPERVVERVPAGRRQRRNEQPDRPRPAERLAAVGHLVDGERHSNPVELYWRCRRQHRWRPPTSARPMSSGRATPAATVCHPSTPAIRASREAPSEKRSSTSTASRCRTSERTAISYRRTTSGRPHGSTTT